MTELQQVLAAIDGSGPLGMTHSEIAKATGLGVIVVDLIVRCLYSNDLIARDSSRDHEPWMLTVLGDEVLSCRAVAAQQASAE